MKVITNTTHIVIIGMQSWDIEIGSNCKNLALEMSKTHKVLYVNRPLDRNTLRLEANTSQTEHRLDVKRGISSQYEIINENLVAFTPKIVLESINWVPDSFVYDMLNYINNKRLANEIDLAIRTTKSTDFILFNDNDFIRGQYMVEMLKPKYSIFYIRDFFTSQDYFKKHGKRLEPKAFKKYDCVVANSAYLSNYAAEYQPNSHYVGQGCDFENFDINKSLTKPKDLIPIKKKIVGYIGSLTSMRLDIKLIRDIAISMPHIAIVLVGPEDGEFRKSELHELRNVYFLGNKQESELANYVKHFDVCINPQLINELTIGNYPRKIDEYLALGKPTVATLTETMKTFKQHVYLGKTSNDYLVAINKSLADTKEKQDARIEFATSHTWTNNVKEIFNAVELAVRKKQ